MATCDTLPVYKCSYDLMLKIMGVVNGFSKDYRYSLGERLTLRVWTTHKATRCLMKSLSRGKATGRRHEV